MSVNLTKGSTVSLTKSTDDSLKKVFLGLGWDVAKKGGGFFGKLLGGDSGSIDLDASCIMYDSNKNIVDSVWFRQLKSKDGSVVHSGDNRTGAGSGDDEVISVDLSQIPSNVQSLVFVINSFTGQNFSQIDNAFCRLVDAPNNKELAKYTLSEKGSHTAQIMAKLYRDGSGWSMKAIGEIANGATWLDLGNQAKTFA